MLKEEPIICNAGGETRVLNVTNLGDRPIQVGSHYHFAEVNHSLDLDRVAARGFRLDIPAGTAVRFEPGDARSVHLVELAGNREVYGLQNLVNGSVGGSIPAKDTDAIGGTAGVRPMGAPDVAEGYDIEVANVGHDNVGFHTTFGWDPVDESRGPEAARDALAEATRAVSESNPSDSPQGDNDGDDDETTPEGGRA